MCLGLVQFWLRVWVSGFGFRVSGFPIEAAAGDFPSGRDGSASPRHVVGRALVERLAPPPLKHLASQHILKRKPPSTLNPIAQTSL